MCFFLCVEFLRALESQKSMFDFVASSVLLIYDGSLDRDTLRKPAPPSAVSASPAPAPAPAAALQPHAHAPVPTHAPNPLRTKGGKLSPHTTAAAGTRKSLALFSSYRRCTFHSPLAFVCTQRLACVRTCG